ncbi:11576_t:CDS:2, partial [Dentiscutata erythropus]
SPSLSYDTASSHKVVRSSSYGPLDNYVIRLLSKQDKETFEILLLRLTLPDHRILGEQILNAAVSKQNETMLNELCQDKIVIILSFDGWTNVKNEQLLGIMITTSEGNLHVWKAIDISLKRKLYIEVIEKTKAMINELKNMETILRIASKGAPGTTMKPLETNEGVESKGEVVSLENE